MRYYRTIVLGVVFAGLFAAFARADVVLLKGGQKLVGDIVAERHEHIYVDIGVTVVAVPKEDVLEYHYDKEGDGSTLSMQAAEANEITAEPVTGRLYHTGKFQKRTIEQCVAEVGEAVVKVSSPAGMGSGFFIN
jgi:hypothetical protein